MITVFYDGKCSLCNREIKYYKRIAPDGIFEWIDITVDASSLERLGISYPDGLKLLHVQDESGKIHTGIDGFLTIWQHLNRWKYVGVFINLPIIRSITETLYILFAAWRFRRLDHCQIALKDQKIKPTSRKD